MHTRTPAAPLLTLLSLAGAAHAATVTWNVNGPDSLWNNRNNWIGGRVPGGNDLAVIPAGASALVSQNAVVVGGLYVQPGGSVTAVTNLYVIGGASIQGNMSLAGAGGRFIHRDDVNFEGTLTMWSGAAIDRYFQGTGTFTVRPNGRIVIPAYDDAGVTLATSLVLQGWLDDQSTQPVSIGQLPGETGVGVFLSIEGGATAHFAKTCTVAGTNNPGQPQPYIVNAGAIQIDGPASNVVNFADNLALFNAGVVNVDQPDLHIRNSWDFNTSDGTLMRGFWAAQNYGRIFFDNGRFVRLGHDASIFLAGPGSSVFPFSESQFNDGNITLENGANAAVLPGSGDYVNHGRITIGHSSAFGVGGRFVNAPDGNVDAWIAGPDDGSHGRVVASDAALDGTYNAQIEASYSPGAADAVVAVSTTGALSGRFANVNILYSGFPFRMTYDARNAVLTSGCRTDFNGDGFLDFFDYDDFVNCFETGSCPNGMTADFNGDAFVDFFDYDDFVSAFESGC